MEKVCLKLSVADMKIRISSDCDLPFQEILAKFYSEFESADITYKVRIVDNPDDFIPKSAKHIYSGTGLKVYEHDGQLYHRYAYAGEMSVLSIGDENIIYVSSDELLPINIQKSLALETLIIDLDGIFMHASLINAGGKGIIFSAPSGVGKSTQASLWEKHRGAKILNGDRAAIRFVNGKWRAYGSPWAGSSGIYRREGVEIAAIVFLGQSKKNVITKLTGIKAFNAIMNGGIFPYWNKEKMVSVCKISEKILAEVPVFEFTCTPDLSAVEELEKYI